MATAYGYSAPAVQISKSWSNKISLGPGPLITMNPGGCLASPLPLLIVAHVSHCSDLTGDLSFHTLPQQRPVPPAARWLRWEYILLVI